MRFFLCWGFGIWLVASAVFRLMGHYFFTLEEPFLMIAAYILTIPLIWVVTIPIYILKKIKDTERLLAAICIALPGMLIDAVVLLVFDNIFPNLSPDLARYFASWLLWAYSLILITGFTKVSFVRKNSMHSSN
ncbi:hypothetical protein AMS59_02915 [Lysinibacillus sp. FJAT-14745]|uniref:DUF5367 domain-containing protein n=1 Tax=Lysinibacillus sp. FJAT-14745 TaxID=1704289 RepID=UPI0006ABCBF4|nr:DUF5367 domain-containing protein [Lysinibacillus sp. FJAT-14745]KOP80360.1 hypothetical protein AMS59_02915 [Lysinibacillus sp. FJAT-14745]